MQTVSVKHLRDEPLRSLWYLHIQPPLFDAYRAVLARFYSSLEAGALVDAVDRWIYVAWAAAFAATAALVFAWIHALAGQRLALVATAVWVLHPAGLAFATLLDTTVAGAAAFLWFCFELWRLSRSKGSTTRLAVASLVLFFLRSIFQWPFLLLVVACLILLRLPRRRILGYGAVVGLVAGLYVLKQLVLFGTPLTSTFDGRNFCRAIGLGKADVSAVQVPPRMLPASLPDPSSAAVLREARKIGGSYNYNHLDYLRLSMRLKYFCGRALLERPLGTTLASLAENFSLYGLPASRYSPNVLVDALPWRDAFDFVFSAPVLWLLLIAACASAARRLRSWEDSGRAAALVLPVLYVAVAGILFEKGENMRFRYFIEPVLFVFFGVELGRFVRSPRGTRID
jgi:hypothetical protein